MTWSEKLIAEWLELKGYYVRMSVPLESKEVGGRGEADVIGLKIVKGKPNILHIEVGNLGSSIDKNLDIVKQKFAPENRKYVTNSMGLPEETPWESRYIAPYISRKSLSHIRKKGFNIDTLAEVLKFEILPDILTWENKVSKTRRTTQMPTPPYKLDLICLLDFLLRHKILVIKNANNE